MIFLDTVEKLNIEKVDIHSALLFFNTLSSQDFPYRTVIAIMEAEIISIFASLKNVSSLGYDGISNRILKCFAKPLDKPLAYISNKSLTAGKFLGHLKYSVVNSFFF